MIVHPRILRRIDRQLHAHLPVNIVGGMTLGTSFQSIPRFGFPSQSRGLRVSIFVPCPIGIDSRSFNFVTVVKRALSIKPELKLQAVTNGESLAEDANLCQSFTKFNAIKKRRKWVRPEAARRSSNGALTSSSKQPAEESVGSSPLSPFEGEKDSNARQKLSNNGKKEISGVKAVSTPGPSKAGEESHVGVNPHPQSRNKTKKKNSGSTLTSTNVSSNNLRVSNPKDDKNTAGNRPSTPAKNGLAGKTLSEVADASVSSKKMSKKSKNSKSAGAPKEAAAAVLETNGATVKPVENMKEAPFSHDSLMKSKPAKHSETKASEYSLAPLYPSSGKSIVVVESATKAKVIQGYLGDMYEVIPSYGHVRDLAARSGSVRPDEGFSMVWEVPAPAWTHLKNIKVAITGARNLILASDPDREGEAIAWHIYEMLLQQDALHKDLTIARVVFQEVTETAIKSALQNPRVIDINLVNAYLARRAIDYLIGFNISPVLWRKLPGCSSAGRVQSAALSLICDREMEIDEFKPLEYWTVEATFRRKQSQSSSDNYLVMSYLTHFDSKRLNQHSITSENEAKDIELSLHSSNFKVMDSKRSRINKNPPSPFITSTLQQDAANKLKFSAAYTMKLAQKLYEGVQLSDGKGTGLITYMRTDGLHLSDKAVKDICSVILERYGKQFVPSAPRKFFRKVKNAQEAHEAIRPTDIHRLPSTLVGTLDEDSLRLYTLIWTRTMACQMESEKFDQIQVDIGNESGSIALRAASSRIAFPGYRAVYEDREADAISYNKNEPDESDDAFKFLSSLKKGGQCIIDKVELKQHHTQPPPRYSEASLIKRLEELGIGRPSTYASTLKVLQDRKYVTVKSRMLLPEFRGRMVSAFLADLFSEVTDYSFTADMETELDNVSTGLTEWKGLLKDYWTRFSGYCERASKVQVRQVEKMLERTFSYVLFSSLPNGSRTCPSCLEGTLIMKISRFGEGYFIGCDQHPKCKYIAKTIYGGDEDDNTSETRTVDEPMLLGNHPDSNLKVFLKNGPYGYYIQLGDDRKGYVPKRSPIPTFMNAESISLEDAVQLLRYPKTLGTHPDSGRPVVLKIGKSGSTIRHGRSFALVPKRWKPDEVTLEIAMKILKGKGVTKSGRPKGKPKAEPVEVH
ncbi:hypothetical protein Drorol1_Dr00012914 [Drosera rotundifolia]